MSENEKLELEKAEVKDSADAKADKKVEKKNDKKAVKKEKKDRKRPFAEMIAELKKVSWPSKADMRTYAVCVIVFVVVCAVILAVMDMGVTALVKYISSPEKLPTVLNGWFNIG